MPLLPLEGVLALLTSRAVLPSLPATRDEPSFFFSNRRYGTSARISLLPTSSPFPEFRRGHFPDYDELCLVPFFAICRSHVRRVETSADLFFFFSERSVRTLF